MKKGLKHECMNCERAFYVGAQSSTRCPYCKSLLTKRVPLNKKKKPTRKNCVICGVEFVTTDTRKVICSDAVCRVKHYRRNEPSRNADKRREKALRALSKRSRVGGFGLDSESLFCQPSEAWTITDPFQAEKCDSCYELPMTHAWNCIYPAP